MAQNDVEQYLHLTFCYDVIASDTSFNKMKTVNSSNSSDVLVT